MKKITKVLSLATALALFVGCGAKDDTKAPEGSQETNPSVETAENTGNSDLVSDGVIDIGTSADFPPYEFYDGEEIVGIDPDIAKEIGDKLGLEVKFHDMDFSAIVASVESGKLDAGMAGLTVTDERKKQVNFSDTYATSVQKVLVKKDSDIKAIEDLEGKKIGTQLGTTGDIYAQDDFGEENVQSFTKYADAVLALQNGKIDAILLDEQTANKFNDANDDLNILETFYAEEEYAIAITKDNEKLLEEVNNLIKELKDSGKLDEIIGNYIK
jgi:ABC-type amino acid transport substrate-binding protein